MPSETQIQVIFKSKTPHYAVPETPILIPTQLKKAGLSEIIHHLLDLGKYHVLFVFYKITKPLYNVNL